MADSAAAPAPPTEGVANLHLDEVTGEHISKSELKKRQKQRQKEAEKAAKAAAAGPSKPSSKPKNAAGEEEKDLNPNQYYEIRTRHVNERMRHAPWSMHACIPYLLTDPVFCTRSAQEPRDQPVPAQVQRDV
jgi:lysyl-tRNA synthetase class 2